MPALKWGLNVTSGCMKKHFKDSKSNELIVEHRIDVIEPLILYLHSKSIDYFKLVHEKQLTKSIHEALCNKFIEETWNFTQLLRWVSISLRVEFSILEKMICTTIVQKYYFK
uniref:Uncharacterized protein n=1 Tax=Panagrolaimus sp. PS1159 TaxID=55785 RepID=A0AC35FD90_9BILA